MRVFFTFFIACCMVLSASAQPCSTTNGTNCLCPDGGQQCQLLPDLTVARDILLEADLNPEIDGELRVSVATPNIGYGPLEVHASYYFVCGTDTVYSPGGMTTCSDGSFPRQLIQQTVYRKNGDEIISDWRWAGSMTYHPTHGHMHVDDWCRFSLRIPIDGEPNPFNWIVVAEGAKLGFCLMDYGSCEYYNGYCRNADDEILNNTNMPNYGMGGGEYSCGFSQGISAGWTDIYHHYLDGMDIPIGPDVCDGDYYLMIEVDPNNNFAETKDDNNIMVVPFTLTEQNPKPASVISASGDVTLCKGDHYDVSATMGEQFIWNTGDTTAAVSLTQAGEYYVTVITPCEAIASDTLRIQVLDADISETIGDTICTTSGVATLSTTADGDVSWYDAPIGGNLLGIGNTFVTPEINTTTTYYVEQTKLFGGGIQFNEPHNNTFGNGGVNSSQFNGRMIFDAMQPITLKSVKVYVPADGSAGEHLFELYDSEGNVLQDTLVYIGIGESRAELNFEVLPGTNYQLGTAEHPGFWRTNTNVNFPYELEGLVSITGSSYDNPDAGNYYYYYFYDWEIAEPDYLCQSTERTPVTAVVENCVGITQASFAANVAVFPNPSNGIFNLQATLPNSLTTHISISDMTGRIVWQQTINTVGSYTTPINLSAQTAGIYWLQIESNGERYVQKIVRY